MPTDESLLMGSIARWFWNIPDGSWGAASLYHMMTAMGFTQGAEQARLWPKFNSILISPTYRKLIRIKYGIDVRTAEVDGTVASVRFRRDSGAAMPAFDGEPKPPVKTKPKKAKSRDPRLPTPGVAMVRMMLIHGTQHHLVARETPDGKFEMTVDGGNIGGLAKTLSEAARLLKNHMTGVSHQGVNGYEFFGLAKKRDKKPTKTPDPWIAGDDIGLDLGSWTDKTPAQMGAMLEASKVLDEPDPVPVAKEKDLCKCGHGIDNDHDGDCSSCAPKPPVSKTDIKQAFTDAGEFVNHRARPSSLWGATLVNNNGEWFAMARGIVAPGATPEEAMLNWDSMFKTGNLPRGHSR